jgi:uncharacterized membrane protein
MNRKLIPDALIVPAILGFGVLFFAIGYWPDRSVMDGALAVLSGAVSCAFWTFLEWIYHRDQVEIEKERSRNHFGLV